MLHEREHAIDNIIRPENKNKLVYKKIPAKEDLNYKKYITNSLVLNNFKRSLSLAEDEIFAKYKGGEEIKSISGFNSVYDYNKETRDKYINLIDRDISLSDIEKYKLKESINFFQLEYDKVLKNMMYILYSKTESIEYLRNLPINEWYKVSNGKFKRTDFIIKEFKF